MKREKQWVTGLAAALSMVAALFGSSVAFGQAALMDRPSSCEAINCNAITLRGSIKAGERFITTAFVKTGECLRVEVVQQSNPSVAPDTTLALIEPSGNPFLWDDDGAGDLRPVIINEVSPTWATGRWTLLVGHYATSGTTTFTLKYGRYPLGNVNCQGDQTAIRFHNEAPATTANRGSVPAKLLNRPHNAAFDDVYEEVEY